MHRHRHRRHRHAVRVVGVHEIGLQLAQHAPPVQLGQRVVQCDRSRAGLGRQLQRGEGLEAFGVGDLLHLAGVEEFPQGRAEAPGAVRRPFDGDQLGDAFQVDGVGHRPAALAHLRDQIAAAGQSAALGLREQRHRFLTPGSGYQPGNAQMFNGNN